MPAQYWENIGVEGQSQFHYPTQSCQRGPRHINGQPAHGKEHYLLSRDAQQVRARSSIRPLQRTVAAIDEHPELVPNQLFAARLSRVVPHLLGFMKGRAQVSVHSSTCNPSVSFS